MRRPLAFFLLLLSACASAPAFVEPSKRADLVGKSRQDVVAALGAPAAAESNGGEERLTYVHDRVVRYGPSGPAIATRYYCRVTFRLVEERVVAVETEGPDCGN